MDRLLDAGVKEVAVLDVSPTALARAKARPGARVDSVSWIAVDVTAVESVGEFDVWHDRAAFHLLTHPTDRHAYAALAQRTVPFGGHLVLATFSLDGATHCSGLPVERYSPKALQAEFDDVFTLVDSTEDMHTTPSGATQAFVYTVFKHRR